MPDLDYRQKAWSAGLIVLFFVAWELFCLVTGMSDLVLPRPSQVFVTLFEKFPILWPHILQTLATVNGSRRAAVQRLGISERTLRNKLQQYRLAAVN